jgi:hypothetical protein
MVNFLSFVDIMALLRFFITRYSVQQIDLFVPVTNTPPVILGLTDGVLECGTIISGVNYEVLVNTFDVDGETLTLFLGEDADSEIPL